ncbi:MAG TPA: pyridoxal-phosphate dependent enzyme, partial [Ktedonobacteraceae bacterium]|nr:pyridoxal-phosphate dependent enzyme [Ktedonobacteraceae bacterium]
QDEEHSEGNDVMEMKTEASQDNMRFFHSMIDAIGNTPLMQLNKVASDVRPLVLAKMEMFNPGGSVKDRIGPAMIEYCEKQGLLRPGGTIVEPTSGNTGHGLASCCDKGVPLHICHDR